MRVQKVIDALKVFEGHTVCLTTIDIGPVNIPVVKVHRLRRKDRCFPDCNIILHDGWDHALLSGRYVPDGVVLNSRRIEDIAYTYPFVTITTKPHPTKLRMRTIEILDEKVKG